MSDQSQRKVRTLIESAAMDSAVDAKWAKVINTFIQKISVPSKELTLASETYSDIGSHIDLDLGLSAGTREIYPQGSMRLGTTIRSHGNEYFDVDAVCEMRLPTTLPLDKAYDKVGKSLEKVAGVKEVKKKKRCWEVHFHRQDKDGNDIKFTIDVTPAIPDSPKGGTNIQVYNSHLDYPLLGLNPTPSNPKGYIEYFEKVASMRLPFSITEDRGVVTAKVQPLDVQEDHPTDVLRRSIKLMKFHRDQYYRGRQDADFKPISIIISTLASVAYAEKVKDPRITSPVQLLLAVVDRMRDVPVGANGEYRVMNPTNPGVNGQGGENFADKWPFDNGIRKLHYFKWLDTLEGDLAELFNPKADIERIRNSFGGVGGEAWQNAFGQQATSVLRNFASSSPTTVPDVPKQNNTLA